MSIKTRDVIISSVIEHRQKAKPFPMKSLKYITHNRLQSIVHKFYPILLHALQLLYSVKNINSINGKIRQNVSWIFFTSWVLILLLVIFNLLPFQDRSNKSKLSNRIYVTDLYPPPNISGLVLIKENTISVILIFQILVPHCLSPLFDSHFVKLLQFLVNFCSISFPTTSLYSGIWVYTSPVIKLSSLMHFINLVLQN